jgi:diguanylate cyclase (GGDEF)-like protein
MEKLFLKQAMTEGEFGQAKLRVVLPVIALLGFVVAHWLGVQVDIKAVLMVCLLHIALDLVWGVVVLQQKLPVRPRRTLAVLIDDAKIGWVLMIEPGTAAPICCLALFSAIGHGLRFGPGIAAWASLSGAVAMAWCFNSSAFWRSVPQLSLGLLLAQVALPIYTTLLARSVQREREDAKQLVRALEEQRKIDHLTGGYNRAGFLAEVESALRATRARGQASAVFYMDLDGFKAVNDMFGHAASDEMLKGVVVALRKKVRADDIVARLGGDEFGVVAHGIDSRDVAERVGRELLAAVSAVRPAGNGQVHVGASSGAAVIVAKAIASDHTGTQTARTEVTAHATNIVAIADRRMLRTKATGKAQVVVDSLI